VDPIAFSPDGKTLASGGTQDFQILCWDTSGFVRQDSAK
jgi:WD40 repeat protein